ncbi:hypothetical protein BC833DRAFT_347953, partial [Globomyces pollinis-pini]
MAESNDYILAADLAQEQLKSPFYPRRTENPTDNQLNSPFSLLIGRSDTPTKLKAVKGRFIWSTPAIQRLLNLRCVESKSLFLATQSKAQINNAWMGIARQLTDEGFRVQANQCITKYSNLKKDYSTIFNQQRVDTGNLTENKIKTPEYWEDLVENFGNKKG